MILADVDIRRRLDSGLVIEPLQDLQTQLQPASVDLRLGTRFRRFNTFDTLRLDPLDPDSFTDHTDEVLLKEDEHLVLQPSDFLLATTAEYVAMPLDLVARIEGRSSIGRMGVLVHSTAGFIDPGFCGQITLEMSNIGRLPVVLYPGMRICQIAFEQLTVPAHVAYGSRRGSKYQHQRSPAPSAVWQDREFRQKRGEE